MRPAGARGARSAPVITAALVTTQPRAVLLAPSDTASCGVDSDELPARILDTIPGIVLTLGDNAFPDGTLSTYVSCYDPTWGRHKAHTYATLGNHEYKTGTAAGAFDYFGDRAGPRNQGHYSFDLGAWPYRLELQRRLRPVHRRLRAGPVAPGRPRREHQAVHPRGLASSAVLLVARGRLHVRGPHRDDLEPALRRGGGRRGGFGAGHQGIQRGHGRRERRTPDGHRGEQRSRGWRLRRAAPDPVRRPLRLAIRAHNGRDIRRLGERSVPLSLGDLKALVWSLVSQRSARLLRVSGSTGKRRTPAASPALASSPGPPARGASAGSSAG